MNGYIYLLKSSTTNSSYLGSTKNINDRISRHNQGRVKSTKNGIPWKVLLVVNVEDSTLAIKIESYIKKQKEKLSVKNVVKNINNFYKLER